MRYLSLGLDGEGLRQFMQPGFDPLVELVMEVGLGDEIYSVGIRKLPDAGSHVHAPQPAEPLALDEAAEVIGRLFIAVGAFPRGVRPKEPRKTAEKTQDLKTQDARKELRQGVGLSDSSSSLESSSLGSCVSRLKGGAQ